MNDIFYSIGFLYIAYMIHQIISQIQKFRKGKFNNIDEIIPSEVSIDEIKKLNEIAKKPMGSLNIISHCLGIIFLVWTIIGYRFTESNLFLANLIVIGIFLLLFCITIISTVLLSLSGNEKFKEAKADHNNKSKLPLAISFLIVDKLLKIPIIALILYNHFITNTI